jgi:hypothetical protein
MTTPVTPARPEGVCPNCFAAWQARRPRPTAVHCWHGRTVAWPKADGWHIEPALDSVLRRLRVEDRL